MKAAYGTVEYDEEVAEFRKGLEHRYGTVWNTAEVTNDFDITGFLAPRCTATHIDTDIKGTLTFTHSPRFYFDFHPLSDNEYQIWKEATKITVTPL